MPKLVLGVDGGGTKTEVAIVDSQGNVRGTGTGAPLITTMLASKKRVPIFRSRSNEPVPAAGIIAPPFDAAFLGMAGVVSASDRTTIKAIATESTSPHRNASTSTMIVVSRSQVG